MSPSREGQPEGFEEDVMERYPPALLLPLPGRGDIGQSPGQHRGLHVQGRGNGPPGRQVDEARGPLPGQSKPPIPLPPQPLRHASCSHTLSWLIPSISDHTFLPLPSGAVPLVQRPCRCQGDLAGSEAMRAPSQCCAGAWRGLADGVHEGEDQEVHE